MLITKTVIKKWNSHNKKYYELRGYTYTKMNDEFEIRVQDLPERSTDVITLRCDNIYCNKDFNIKYSEYLEDYHNVDKQYCKWCNKRINNEYDEQGIKITLNEKLERICNVDGCSNKYHGKGVCSMHLTHMERFECDICGSKKQTTYYPKTNQYLCCKHRRQMSIYGSISARTTYDKNEIILYDDYAEVVLYNKKSEEVARTKIDLEDIEKIKNGKCGFRSKDGYAYITTKNRSIESLHRFLTNPPENLQVDHINRDRLDNRKKNLRFVTNQLNSFNSSKNKNNTSGIIGVRWNEYYQQWSAEISYNYKGISLGLFDEKEDAIKARLKAELKYFGEEFSPQRHLFEKYNIETINNNGVII